MIGMSPTTTISCKELITSLPYRNPEEVWMILTVKRLDSDGRYETLIARDDGVSFSLLGVAHIFAIPHDVAHFVIENALRLDAGFWGSIADGAVFPTMRYESGRRKPKAAETIKSSIERERKKTHRG
jgi:hypothetical protein